MHNIKWKSLILSIILLVIGIPVTLLTDFLKEVLPNWQAKALFIGLIVLLAILIYLIRTPNERVWRLASLTFMILLFLSQLLTGIQNNPLGEQTAQKVLQPPLEESNTKIQSLESKIANLESKLQNLQDSLQYFQDQLSKVPDTKYFMQQIQAQTSIFGSLEARIEKLESKQTEQYELLLLQYTLLRPGSRLQGVFSAAFLSWFKDFQSAAILTRMDISGFPGGDLALIRRSLFIRLHEYVYIGWGWGLGFVFLKPENTSSEPLFPRSGIYFNYGVEILLKFGGFGLIGSVQITL
jgi:uncharacterized coiled-coil protein SlyX